MRTSVLLVLVSLLGLVGLRATAADSAAQDAVSFYPSQSEVRPGAEVDWTITIPEGTEWVPPFTISAELNNDDKPDLALVAAQRRVTVRFSYNDPSIYVPYVTILDSAGKSAKVYSRDVLAVLPDLDPRKGVGLTIPTPEAPSGDFIKAVHVLNFDQTKFGTASGISIMQRELDRLAGLGVNMVIYNIEWFFDEQTSSIHEPIYTKPASGGFGTMPLADLIALSDWTHARGMRVGLRYFLWQRGVGYGNPRAGYSPADSELYLRYQTAIKVLYARVAQSLGIELFCLDSENQAFTSNPGVVALIQRVREVYDGALTDGAYDVNRVYDCPFTQELDLVSWSDYYFGSHDLESESLDQETLTRAFLEHYQRDVEPVLEHVGKPGLFMECGVDIQGHSDALAATVYKAYLEASATLVSEQAPMCGSCWWDWDLADPGRSDEDCCPRGRAAEGVLGHYFTDVLPDLATYSFSWQQQVVPGVAQPLAGFDTGQFPALEVWNEGGLFTYSVDSLVAYEGRSLKLAFAPSIEAVGDSAPWRYGFVWQAFSQPQDWSRYGSLSFWMKSDGALCCGVEVGVYDWDGDRFTLRVDSKPYVTGWQNVTVSFESLGQPDWADRNDGVLDLSRIRKWGIGWLWQDRDPHTMWIDTVYLAAASPS